MIRYHASHACWLSRDSEYALVLGVAGGRVRPYDDSAKWLYSLRVLLLFFKFEILWTTGS